MATPAPYLKNLSALEQKAFDLTAFTPHSAPVAYAAFTGLSQAGTYTAATTGSASALPRTPRATPWP